jgi:hypothetical protein
VENSCLEQGAEHAVLVVEHFHIDIVPLVAASRFAYSLFPLGLMVVVVAYIDTAVAAVLEQQNGCMFGEGAHIALEELRTAQKCLREHSLEEELRVVQELELNSLQVMKIWSCGLVVPQTEAQDSEALCSQFVPRSLLPSVRDAQVSVALVSGASSPR